MIVEIPDLNTDAEAEAILDQDLSGFDFSQFKPIRLEFAPRAEPSDRAAAQPGSERPEPSPRPRTFVKRP